MTGPDAGQLAAEPGTVVLEGLHAVKHALRFGADVPVLLTADVAGTLALAQELAPDVAPRLRAGLVEVEPAAVGRIAGGRAALVGLARRPPPVPLDGPRATPAVLLDNPRHLGNLGAVVRVAAGFGASAVLSTGSVDPWHPTVVRAAAGLHYATVVQRVGSVELPGPLLAFDPAGDDLRGVTVPDDALLAFGSERHGLSPAVRTRADGLLAIPMRELVSSYNLATSVAVALYSWTAGIRD